LIPQAVPVERQCSRLERYGVHIAPSTLGRGVCATIDLLAPVARLIQTQTRGPALLGTDATLIPILDPTTSEGIRNGTMWCWTNARWVSFVYASRGDSDSVCTFLGGKLAPNQDWAPRGERLERRNSPGSGRSGSTDDPRPRSGLPFFLVFAAESGQKARDRRVALPNGRI